MKTIFFILPTLFLFSSFFTVNVADALIVAYSLEDLAETSEFVVIGEITEITPLVPGYLLVFSDGYDRFQFDVTLSIEHDLDEKYDQNTIQFRIHDSREEFGLGIEDEQKFKVGERVLVFIGEKEPDSVMGDAYLVHGVTQGKYLLENGMAFGIHYPEVIDENELILKIQNIRHAKPIPEPEQEIIEYERCGPGTTFQNGICVVTELEENTIKSESNRWSVPALNNDIQYPLKQFKSGISIEEIQCKDNLVIIQKYDGSPACVKHETVHTLEKRNWGISYTHLQKLVEDSDAIITGMVIGVDNRPNGERHVWLGSYEWLRQGIYDEQQLFLEQSERNPRPMEVQFSKGEEVLLFLKDVDVKRGAYDLLSINGIHPQKYSISLRDSIWSFFDHNFYNIEPKPENSSNCSEKFFGTDKYSYCTTKKSSYVPVDELMEKVREKMLESISEEYLREHFDLRVVYDQPDPVYEPEPGGGSYIPPEKAKQQNIEFVFSLDGMDFVYSMTTRYLEDQQKIDLKYIPPREIQSLANQKEIDDLIQSCLDGKYKFLYSPPYIGYHDEYGFSPAVGGHGPPIVFDRWSDDRIQEREMVFRIWLAESDVECSLHNESFDPDHSKRPDLVPLIDLRES